MGMICINEKKLHLLYADFKTVLDSYLIIFLPKEDDILILDIWLFLEHDNAILYIHLKMSFVFTFYLDYFGSL